MGAYRTGATQRFYFASDNAEMCDTSAVMTGTPVPWGPGNPTAYNDYTYNRVYYDGSDNLLYDYGYWIYNKYYICEHYSMTAFL